MGFYWLKSFLCQNKLLLCYRHYWKFFLYKFHHFLRHKTEYRRWNIWENVPYLNFNQQNAACEILNDFSLLESIRFHDLLKTLYSIVQCCCWKIVAAFSRFCILMCFYVSILRFIFSLIFTISIKTHKIFKDH